MKNQHGEEHIKRDEVGEADRERVQGVGVHPEGVPWGVRELGKRAEVGK